MGTNRNLLSAILALVLLFTPFAATARIFENIPDEQVEEIFVKTDDGVHEKLIHIKNPGKPIILLEPGLGAQGTSLELPATALRLRGDYDVFIGNWRGSAKLPEGMKALGEQNGVREVLQKDFPAHLRYILNEYATPAQKEMKISLFGHSMGGMMIMSTLSDLRLGSEFKPFIKSIVLFQSPHHLKYLQGRVKALAKVGLPTLRKLKSLGIDAIDMHSKLLLHSKNAKEKGGFLGRFLTPAIENFAMQLTRLAISPAHTGRELMRRAFFKMSAYSIPIDLMHDFVKAVLDNEGDFRDASGERLIKPELVDGMPIQVVRARLDTLAPWQQQAEYFDEIASARKQLLSIPEMNHVDSVLSERSEMDFFDHVLDFLRDPAGQSLRFPRIDFKPRCESLLTRIALKIRLRGI